MHVLSDEVERNLHIVVLGPNPYRRAGIRRTLEAAHLGVLGEAADHSAIIQLVAGQLADVIVLDGPLPAQAAAADALCSVPRPLKLVAMLGENEQSYLVTLLRTKVRGLVNADGRPGELVRAVRCVLDGGLYISPAFAEAVVDALLTRVPPPPARAASVPRAALTPRERDVVGYLASGLPNADIATTLHISEKTVKFHVSNILSKYQFRSRAQLIVAMAGALPVPVEGPDQ